MLRFFERAPEIPEGVYCISPFHPSSPTHSIIVPPSTSYEHSARSERMLRWEGGKGVCVCVCIRERVRAIHFFHGEIKISTCAVYCAALSTCGRSPLLHPLVCRCWNPARSCWLIPWSRCGSLTPAWIVSSPLKDLGTGSGSP